jgi:hypothetical protein
MEEQVLIEVIVDRGVENVLKPRSGIVPQTLLAR